GILEITVDQHRVPGTEWASGKVNEKVPAREGRAWRGTRAYDNVIRTEVGVRRPPGPLLAVAGRSSPYERLEKVTARRPERRADQYPPGVAPCIPGPHGLGAFPSSGRSEARGRGPRKVR